MKRILLISSNTCREPFPVFPFGMAVIAGVCRSEDWNVTQYDVLVSGMEPLEKLLSEETFDAVGISIRNIDTVNSLSPDETLAQTPVRISELVRKLTKAVLILGGSGFSLMPEVMLERTGADYGVAGEGEIPFRQLLHEIETGKFAPERIRKSTMSAPCEAYEDPVIFDWYNRQTHMIQVQTKRGCPFGCVYCTYPFIEGSCFRYRKPEDFIPRIARLHKQDPYLMFYIVDSVFNDPAGHWKTVLAELQKQVPGVKFDCFLTPFRLGEAEADLLVRGGMVATDIGIDATTDTTIAGLGKHYCFQDAFRTAERLSEQKVGVSASVMFGGPGETYDTIREGIDNINSMKCAFTAVFDGVRVFPGTPMEKIARGKGVIPPDWNGLDPLYYYEPGLDPEKVHAMLEEGFHDSPCAVYPPDRFNRVLRTIHKIGYLQYREFK